MKTLDNLIAIVTVGSPARHQALSVYPLTYTGRCAASAYLVLDEALATGRFRITEISESGSVPRLLAINANSAPVFLLDGEELVGAKQNRVLNLSIMLAPKSRTEIPVSCVEAGRWRTESHVFQTAQRVQFARGRAQKMDQVSRSLFLNGEALSDQAAVWNAISAKSARMRVASPTGAMAALFESRHDDLRDYLDAIPTAEGQLGAAYAIGGSLIAHAFHHNAFLIVSNGDRARYGSITSEWEHFNEWKRLDEVDKGNVDAEVLLDGMLAHDRLLDIVENFILFDESKPGATRKVVARNHQVLGVNRAVASVVRQEELKREFPPGRRLEHRVIQLPLERRQTEGRRRVPFVLHAEVAEAPQSPYIPEGPVNIVARAHPDLGRLGVFWHTQGSGKSYSMAFFAEKVRRKVPGNFTFLLMTDRHDLDGQIYKTFAGSGITGKDTPRAGTGDDLERLLKENHPYVFSLIHKFNKDVDPNHPYSERDDIIVISDEAHRTQSGRLARNMRLALPHAAFIGFTGTPLFKQDELTRRIFGNYVSRYDFKRSEEDGASVKLVYENRGEKLSYEYLGKKYGVSACTMPSSSQAQWRTVFQ
jgi:hypothetical protein